MDESSQEGTILRNNVDDDSLEAVEATANLLNVTVPNDTIEKMIDHFDDNGVSVS